jgi:hypothetical protein
MKNSLFFVALALLATIQMLLFAPLQIQPDTATYSNAIALLVGENSAVPDRLMRLSKPLGLFLPTLLYKFGFSAVWALVLQQIIALGLAFWLAYRTFFSWFGDKLRAQFGVLLYASCSPIAVYAYAAITDVLGWAWAWGLLYWATTWLNRSQISNYSILAWAAALGLGVFAKESVLIAGVFLFYAVLLSAAWSWQQKIRIYALSGLAFLSVLSLGLYATRAIWGYNLLDWFAFNHDDESALYNGHWLRVYIVQTFRSLDLLWLCLPFGLWALRRQKSSLTSILLACAATCALAYPFVWAYLTDRIIFMFAPFYLYFILAFWRFGKGNIYLLGCCIIGNTAAAYTAYLLTISGGLWYIYATFAIVLGLTFWYNRPTNTV